MLDGFDISPDQYPPNAWLPQNVHLHIQDAFMPFPEKYHAKYDVVHVRFIITVLHEKDRNGLIQLAENLTTLLSKYGERSISSHEWHLEAREW